MKFLCPNCKAKYQISDEKIAGRTLKMDCRRCDHPIVIRGDNAARGDKAGSAARRSGRGGAPNAVVARRRSGSHVGPMPSRSSSRSALGADFRKNVGTAAPSSRPTALDQWHIAINDVPVGPMRREEVAKKIQSGAVDGESLCWREGFDDWRPLRDVPELAALARRAKPPRPPPAPAFPAPSRALGRSPSPPVRSGRPPAQRTVSATPRPSDAARPAARGNVVPIGGRLGASAAPALDQFSEDEPTRVGSSLEVEADEPADALEPNAYVDVAKEEPPAVVVDDDAFDPFASAPASDPLTPAPSPEVESASEAAVTPAPEAAPSGAAAPEGPLGRRGLPIGAWIAIAGAMAFGVALAAIVGTHLFTQPRDPVAATLPPTPEEADPGPAIPEAEPDLELIEESETTPPVEDAEEPGRDAEETPAAGPRQTGTDRTGTGGSARATKTAQSSGSDIDEAARARLERFRDDSAGAPPLNVTRSSVLGDQSGGGGSSLTGEQIGSVVRREQRTVQQCWQTALRQVGSAPNHDTRIEVMVTITGGGQVSSAQARGPGIAGLNTCIERAVSRWRFPRTGGTTRTSIPFVFQGSG